MHAAIISVTVIVLVLAMAALVLFFLRIQFNSNISRGTRIYRYDPKTRQIIRVEDEAISKTQVFKLLNTTNEKWESIDKISKLLKNSKGDKKFRQALHQVEKGEESVDFEFTSNIPSHPLLKRNEFDIRFRFQKADDGTYIVNVSWKSIEKKRNKKYRRAKLTTREELVNLSAPTTGYVIFNIKGLKEAQKRLLGICQYISTKTLLAIYPAGKLGLVFQGQNTKSVEKKIRRFIKKFNQYGANLGAQQLYEGSAYLVADDAHKTDVQRMGFAILEFFISLSIDKKKNFVTQGTFDYEDADFKLFTQGIKTFQKSVADLSIDFEYLPVRKYGTSRKSASYVRPVIKGINEHIRNTILKNYNSNIQLIEAAATKFSLKQDAQAAIIDITERWLINNKNKMTNRKAVYVIDLEDRVDVEIIRQTVEELKLKGFVFGLNLTQFDEKSSILIKRISPSFVIIDSNFIQDNDLFDSNTYINLVTIATMANKEKIKIIYQNPPEFMDTTTAQKIGLEYYYGKN